MASEAVYEIRLGVRLDPSWSEWFEGMAVSSGEGPETKLSGPIADQTALHGLLAKVRDLGIPLLSVNCIARDMDIDGPAEQDEASRP